MLVLLLAFSAAGRAQYYSAGSDPASIRWRSLESSEFQLVYPSNMDSLAREYLYAFKKYSFTNEQQLKIKYHPIPIVLHPCISQSNASVAWMPHRVDIYTTPEFSRGYGEGWVQKIAKHEGRHIAQMTHYTTGVFKYLNWLVGEQAVALGMGIYPTSWMFEGDAVHAETDFSQVGRGRDPNFLMYFRASFMDGDYRSYDRWRYGSYLYYTPNKYAFGYMMQTAMRRNACSNAIMGDIQQDFANYWYNPGNWNKTFLYRTGMTARKNYRSAVTIFENAWRNDYLSRMPYSGFDRIASESEGYEAFGWKGGYYTEYHSLLPYEDGSLIAVRTGMSQDAHLVRILPDGSEENLRWFAAPSLTSSLVKRDDSHIVWSEIVADPRWELRDRSIIREYDLATGRIRNITNSGHYFNPAFAFDGKVMMVTEYPEEGSSFLVMKDAETGEILRRVEAPRKGQIRRSVAIGERIYADVVTGEGEWGIWSTDACGTEWSVELEPQSRSILNLQAFGDRLVFESDLDGVTNIYSFDPSCSSLQKLTNARFGAFSPYLESDGSLYYTDFDKDGYHPVRAAADSLLRQPVSIDYPFVSDLVETTAEQSRRETVTLTAEQDSTIRSEVAGLESSRYSKFGNILRVHSWAPLYVSVDRIMDFSYDHIYQLAAPGVTLISQNTLGNAVTTMGYSHHGGRNAGHINFNYSGLYPVFELNLDYNDRESATYDFDRKGAAVDTVLNGSNSVDFSASSYVPVILSRGGWQSAVIPRISYEFTSDRYVIDGVGDGYKQGIETSVRYYRMLPKLKAALMPHLGFGVEAKYIDYTGAYKQNGSAASLYMYGYVPGFTPLQGLKVSVLGQKQFRDTYGSYLASFSSMPRGYGKMILGDYAKVSLDYAIPIALNDYEPTPLLYLMRASVVPFVDIAYNKPAGAPAYHMYSYGSAVTLKGHYFRIGAEIEIGARLSRYWDPVTMSWRCRWDFVTGTSL